MASEKQIEANKRNAQRSTGPKTPEGKHKASQNAVTHGLTSHRPVLDNEDTAEFRKYVNELIDQLDPTNPWEFVFAKRAVCQAWRIQRVLCYETLALDNLLKMAQPPVAQPPSAVLLTSADGSDKTNPISSLSPQKSTSRNAKTKNEPNSGGIFKNVPSLSEEHPCGCSGQIENRQSSTCPPGIENEKSLLGQAIVDDFRNHWTLDKLARYEGRIENSMIRCLDKFKKVRESQMMNFTSLRHYFRGFTRRPQDFQDTPGVNEASPLHTDSALTPQESSSPNVAQPPVAQPPVAQSHVAQSHVAQSHVAQPPSAVLLTSADGFDKTNPIPALSPQKLTSNIEITKNEPNSGGTFKDVPSLSEEHPCECSGQIENRQPVPQGSNIENPDASDVSQIDNQKASLINNDFDSFS